MGNLKPYTGPFGKPELLHLLRRTLFGVSKSDLNFFKNKSLNEIIPLLITDTPKLPDPPLRTYYNNPDPKLDTLEKIDKGNGDKETLVEWGKTWVNTPIQANFIANPGNARRNSLKQWMTGLQMHQERNVYEKMVLFYQNLVVTEDSVTENSNANYNTHILYRKHALGKYKQLIKDITLDPGMLRYLNGERNTTKAPDENYGRELQELFCVGKGSGSGYTEEDVKAAARVLTGWFVVYNEVINTVRTNVIPKKAFNNANHDQGVKQFSSFYGSPGSTSISPDLINIKDKGTFDTVEERRAFDEIERMIEMIFNTEEVSKYICRRLWNYFVYYEITPEIESEVIEPLSAIFRQHVNDDNQMKIVLQALFSSEQFFKAEHRGCMIKSPSDFNIGMIRQFEVPLPDSNKLEAQYYMWNVIRSLNLVSGQDINDPPNVAGWPAYYQTPSFHEIWVDTSTYPERKKAYEQVAGSTYALPARNTYDPLNNPSNGFTTKTSFVEFVKKFENPSDPNALIDEAAELLLGVPLSKAVKDKLKTDRLLLGQTTDYYWTDAWEVYLANPNTSDPESRRVPAMLQTLFTDLMSAAEFHLC